MEKTQGSFLAGKGADTAPALARNAEPARPLSYNPAFDGIRGLAVAAVLLFHHGVTWMRGGYLGVSTFFTLSGFLITTLLLSERARTGTVRLSRFWARRIRRLLPASSLTLVGIALLAAVVDQPWERSLRGDVLAALVQVANWRFLFDDRSYGELFSQPSPVLHFWSLAIEEQFYWVFPLVTVGVLALARGSRRVYAGALAVAMVASGALALSLGPDHRDAVYYGTFTRVAEILAGALLASLVFEAKTPGSGVFSSKTHGWWWTAAGAVAVVASAFAWVTVDQSDAGLYRGGLLLYAAASSALVGGAAFSRPLQRVLGWGPLRALGLISYGVYLFHWPIYLVLDSERTGLDASGWALGALRIGVTLVAATSSFVLLEQPIRSGRWPRDLPIRTPLLAGGTVASVAVVALLVPVISIPPDGLEDPFATAQREAAARIAALPDSVPRVLFFGDSSALMIGAGVGDWGLATEDLGVAGGSAVPGCGIGRGGQRRQFGTTGPMPGDECDWSSAWPDEIARHTDPKPRIAVVMTGSWDVVDRKIPDDDRWRGLGDEVYDDFLRSEIAGATDALRSEGLTVVWLTTPPLDFGRSQVPRPPLDPEDTPERVARLNELVREVVADQEGVAVVDLHSYFAGLSPEDDARLRPDGVHVEMATAREAGDWLAPRILQAADSVSGE